MVEVVVGVVFFAALVSLLAIFVLTARRFLVPQGECQITINARKNATAAIGQRLLAVLTQENIHLPSACGGAGTCGLCKVR
ncbi:MAG: 2Fe-2S iron-sulfur cluster-binding protein, partial [Gammaproteobacteria bacterium]|nr:2Fe-2S iron-sulfur cluster-binding protein [Gammaproteobacteria bacterium]